MLLRPRCLQPTSSTHVRWSPRRSRSPRRSPDVAPISFASIGRIAKLRARWQVALERALPRRDNFLDDVLRSNIESSTEPEQPAEPLERRGDRVVAVWLLHREACDVRDRNAARFPGAAAGARMSTARRDSAAAAGGMSRAHSRGTRPARDRAQCAPTSDPARAHAERKAASFRARGRHRRILACRGSGCRGGGHRPTGCRHRPSSPMAAARTTASRLVLEQKAERRLVLRVPGAAAERLDGRLHERRLRRQRSRPSKPHLERSRWQPRSAGSCRRRPHPPRRACSRAWRHTHASTSAAQPCTRSSKDDASSGRSRSAPSVVPPPPLPSPPTASDGATPSSSASSAGSAASGTS